MTIETDREELKRNLMEVRCRFYDYVAHVIKQPPEMRKHYGCTDLDQWMKWQIKSTSDSIEKLVSAFERKYPMD